MFRDENEIENVVDSLIRSGPGRRGSVSEAVTTASIKKLAQQAREKLAGAGEDADDVDGREVADALAAALKKEGAVLILQDMDDVSEDDIEEILKKALKPFGGKVVNVADAVLSQEEQGAWGAGVWVVYK